MNSWLYIFNAQIAYPINLNNKFTFSSGRMELELYFMKYVCWGDSIGWNDMHFVGHWFEICCCFCAIIYSGYNGCWRKIIISTHCFWHEWQQIWVHRCIFSFACFFSQLDEVTITTIVGDRIFDSWYWKVYRRCCWDFLIQMLQNQSLSISM